MKVRELIEFLTNNFDMEEQVFTSYYDQLKKTRTTFEFIEELNINRDKEGRLII